MIVMDDKVPQAAESRRHFTRVDYQTLVPKDDDTSLLSCFHSLTCYEMVHDRELLIVHRVLSFACSGPSLFTDG